MMIAKMTKRSVAGPTSSLSSNNKIDDGRRVDKNSGRFLRVSYSSPSIEKEREQKRRKLFEERKNNCGSSIRSSGFTILML